MTEYWRNFGWALILFLAALAAAAAGGRAGWTIFGVLAGFLWGAAVFRNLASASGGALAGGVGGFLGGEQGAGVYVVGAILGGLLGSFFGWLLRKLTEAIRGRRFQPASARRWRKVGWIFTLLLVGLLAGAAGGNLGAGIGGALWGYLYALMVTDKSALEKIGCISCAAAGGVASGIEGAAGGALGGAFVGWVLHKAYGWLRG